MGSGTSQASSGNRHVGDLSVLNSSEEYHDYICDPCNSVGDEAEAKGYCADCREYLCDACFKSHSRSTVSKHHNLLDQNNMPRLMVKTCDICNTSIPDKTARIRCTHCKSFHCNACFGSQKESGIPPCKNKDKRGNQPTSSALMSTRKHSDTSGQMGKDEFTFLYKINVKAITDERDCFIERMTLVANNELAIVDHYNTTLKIVDTDDKRIKRTMKFQASPFGIATISNDQVAVTFPEKCKIEIISTSENLSLVNTLKTNGSCLGVCFKNEKLYVSYLPMPPLRPIKFQILRLTGAVQKTIKPDSEVLKNCIYPSCIAVSLDESSIFVSDWKTNKVFSIDMDGNMLHMYQDELDHPSDIVVSSLASVYLLNKSEHLLYEVKSDLSEAIVILGLGDGLAFPNAMCFNMSKQQLYISAGSNSAKVNNEIKVYTWK